MSDAQVFSDLFTRLFMLPSSSSKMFGPGPHASAIINLVRNATIGGGPASPEAAILSSRDRTAPFGHDWLRQVPTHGLDLIFQVTYVLGVS